MTLHCGPRETLLLLPLLGSADSRGIVGVWGPTAPVLIVPPPTHSQSPACELATMSQIRGWKSTQPKRDLGSLSCYSALMSLLSQLSHWTESAEGPPCLCIPRAWHKAGHMADPKKWC